jgi:hypothetical protein
MGDQNRIVDKGLYGFANDECRGMVRVGIEFLAKQVLKAPVGIVKIRRRKLKGIFFQYGHGRKGRRYKMADADILVVVQRVAAVFKDAEGVLANLTLGFGIEPTG